MSVNPVVYTVELRNKTFDLVKVLTKYAKNPSWDYNRIGGCGNCTVDLSMQSDLLDDVILPDYDVQIRLENSSGGSDLVYRGYIETMRPIRAVPESIQLQISGYMGQLERVRINKTYSGDEISIIIKDILDTYIVLNTSITYSAGDIEVTSFSVDTLEFDCLADEAIKTLADLAGGIEWGVDRNRNFFFKAQSNTITQYLKLKKDITKYDIRNDYSQIKNRLIIKGGTVSGVKFEDTVDNTESQALYGLRTEIVSNSAIVTNAISQRYGSMIMAKKAKINRRITLRKVNNTVLFENTVPIGRISLLDDTVQQAKKYGDSDAIYGAFKYGSLSSLQVVSIKYKLGNEGTDIDINAGYATPDVSEKIKQLEFEINQLRNT